MFFFRFLFDFIHAEEGNICHNLSVSLTRLYCTSYDSNSIIGSHILIACGYFNVSAPITWHKIMFINEKITFSLCINRRDLYEVN